MGVKTIPALVRSGVRCYLLHGIVVEVGHSGSASYNTWMVCKVDHGFGVCSWGCRWHRECLNREVHGLYRYASMQPGVGWVAQHFPRDPVGRATAGRGGGA